MVAAGHYAYTPGSVYSAGEVVGAGPRSDGKKQPIHFHLPDYALAA